MARSTSPEHHDIDTQWLGLQSLLCDDYLVCSDPPFVSRLGGEFVDLDVRVMALQLDAGLNGLLVSRIRSEAGVRDILTSKDADVILLEEEDGKSIGEHQCKDLAYLLLPCRLLGVLRHEVERPTHVGPGIPSSKSPIPVPKTLKVKPTSRVYHPMMFNWPQALRTSLNSLRASVELRATTHAQPNGKDLVSKLNHLSDLETSSQSIAVLQNIQTACIHLEFLVRGSKVEFSPGSPVHIPGLPTTAEDIIREAERLTTAPLNEESRAKIKRLLKGNTHQLQLPLLVATLISPVFLFQTRNMTNDTWAKRSLIQTSLRLGNQKPSILIEVEQTIWRLLVKLVTSSSPTQLLSEVIAMLEGLPWDTLQGDLVPQDESEWFCCEVPPQEKVSNRHGLFVHVLPPPPRPLSEAPVVTDKTPGSNPKSTVSLTTPHKRTADSDSRPKRSKRRKRTTDRTGDVEFISNSVPNPPSPGVGREEYHVDDAGMSTTSCSPCSSNPPAVTIHNNDAPGGGAPPEVLVATEAGPRHPPSPYRTPVVEANVLPIEHEPPPPSQPLRVDFRSASSRPWAFTPTRGDTMDAPICIDLDAEFLHRTQPPEYNGSKIEKSTTPIYAQTMRGTQVTIHPIYHHRAVWDTLVSVEAAVRRSRNLQPHLTGAMVPPSIFLDWVGQFGEAAGYSGGSSSPQRWRVLFFKTPPHREGHRSSDEFKQCIEVKIFRGYRNFLVLDDQSVSPDPNEPKRIRTVGDPSMLFPDYSLKWGRHNNKILAAHNIPSPHGDNFDLLFCSETVAFQATHLDNTRFCSSVSPSQALSFFSVYMKGSIVYWGISGAGAGLALTLEVGGAYVAVCDPGDGVLFGTGMVHMLSLEYPASLPFHCRIQTIYLQRGNRIALPAGTPYCIYANEDSVIHMRHFYSTVNMPLTHLALSHSLVLGKAVSREPTMLKTALPFLCRTVVFWFDALVRDPPIKDLPLSETELTGQPHVSETSIAYHLPNFDEIDSMSDFFALINTIVFIGAYDLRLYPASERRGDFPPLSADDRALLQLAQDRALRLRNWLPTKYEVINIMTQEEIDIPYFSSLSLLHHGNTLYRYKREAEMTYPDAAHLCTAEETRQQVLQCLAPFDREIQSTIACAEGLPNATFQPQDKAIFLPDEQRAEIPRINPSSPLPLCIIPASRDFPLSKWEIQPRD